MNTLIRILVLLTAFACVVDALAQGLFPRRRSPDPAGYTASSIDYSGVNQNVKFTSSAITMSGSGQALTISCWLNSDTDGTTKYFAQGRNGTTGPQWRANITTTEAINVVVTDSSSTTILNVTTAADVIEAADGWVHFYISVDLSSTGNRAIYLAGTNANVTWSTYTTSGVMALDRTDFISGTADDSASDFDGQVAELWVDDAYWPAATYSSGFISSGNPVNLGSDGSTPTGSAPDLYLRFLSGNLGVNSGADGGTGTLNGPPTSGPSFP